MENLCRKKNKPGLGRLRVNLSDISNRFCNIRDEESANRSKFDCSDSEYFESGIVSRAQSPSQRSPLLQNETEGQVKLSSVTEYDNFSEISLGSQCVFTLDKVVTNTSSFNDDGESTYLPDSNHIKALPVIGCVATTVFCVSCKKFVHSRLDFVASDLCVLIYKIFQEVLPCCELPTWICQGLVHRCPYCRKILGKGSVNE